MPHLHIAREHHLDLPAARQLVHQWIAQAEGQYQMQCAEEPCEATAPPVERWRFGRTGVSGVLSLHPDRFELDLQLGFLLGAFKDRIEAEIRGNLDRLLGA